MVKPLVTIGVCVRNSEDTIGDAIESILDQDFPQELMELMIVDGCSHDNTLEIVRNVLKKTDIRTRIFCENEGLGRARQIVVNNADGEYIVWVDGDMVLSRDFIKKQVGFMNKNPKVGIAKGKMTLKPAGNMLATLEAFSRAAGKMVDYRSKKAYSKVLGTSGSIYRTRSILQVGGFDKDIRGYGEDWDAEIRVRNAGWSLCMTGAEYLDYERLGLTWKALWRRYWRRGYDTHYFLHKNRGMVKHYRMFPPAAVVSGLFHAHKLFKLAHEKAVFLLPIQNMFKMMAWYFGFAKSHMNGYEPES